jgi:hypothetical protein
MGELATQAEDSFTHEYALPFSSGDFSKTSPSRERREHRIYQHLLRMVPGLEERLMEGSNEDIVHVSELVCSSFDFQQPVNIFHETYDI